MTAPIPGLPITLQLHAVDQAGNELAAEDIPTVSVGGKGKSNATIVKVELWNTGVGTGYWAGELHLWIRVST